MLKNLLKKDKQSLLSYNIKEDALKLLLIMLASLYALSLIAYGLFFIIRPVVMWTLFISLLLTVGAFFWVRHSKRIRLISNAAILYLFCLVIPVFIHYGSQTSNSTPLFITLGLIGMFFVLEKRDIWWVLPISAYENIYFLVKDFIWEENDTVIESPQRYFLGFAFTFISAGIMLLVTFLMQEKNFTAASVEIDRSREVEKNAGAAKARFLANMSHEIRTPMNSIIGLSELILKDDMEDSTRNQITVVKQSAYDLLEIIDDVLMYSKLDSGKMNLLNVDFRFDEMLKQILESVSASTARRDLKIRIRIDNNIPKVLNGDDILIKQIIQRLIFISISLTDNGRVMLSIDSKRDENDENVRLICRVSDTGCGLTKGDMDVIYGAYDKFDSRQNTSLKGIGLKFSICKELLKLMNGTLEVNSIDGVGLESKFEFSCKITDPEPMIRVEGGEKKKVLIYIADSRELNTWKAIMEGFRIRPDYVNTYYSFERAVQNTKYDYIFVPNEFYSSVSNVISRFRCAEDTYVIANSKQSYGDFDKCRIIRHPVSSITIVDVLNNLWKADDYVTKDDDAIYDGSKARILVVDDNSVNLKVAAGVFKQYNIDIDIAKSGAEALKKMENIEYHMVLMDMVMPEMSGTETLNRMRESKNKFMIDVPVVALTATTGGNVREEILEQGFQEYLAKPIKQRYLTQCLVNFLPPGVFKKVSKGQKKEETPKNVSETVEIPQGGNVLEPKIGLANLGNSDDAYCEILNTYYNEGQRKLKAFSDYLEAGDIKMFTTDAHGIKSSSASIGAMTVSAMFKELEFAGKDNNTNLINEKYPEYAEAFKKILEDVKQYLTERNRFVDASKAEEKNKGAKAEKLTPDVLAPFKECIDKMDLKTGDKLMAELADRNFGKKGNETIAALKRAYETFDFHQVKEILTNATT